MGTSETPRGTWGIGQKAIRGFVPGEFKRRRIPINVALQSQRNATDENSIHGVSGDLGITDSLSARTHAFQEVPRVAVRAIHSFIIGPERFLENTRRMRDDVAAIHGNAALRADKAGAALAAHRSFGITGGMNNCSVCVVIMDVTLVVLNINHGPGVGIHGPLNDIVVVRAPVDIADEETGQRMSG